MKTEGLEQEVSEAVEAIRRGTPVIYPTETLYALGVNILRPDWVERIVRLKGRPEGKPVPVLIGALEQLALVTEHQNPAVNRLIRDFWPGPLSILVPARAGLSPLLQDDQGSIAVRWTSHPTAQGLAVRSGAPLTATSANVSGRPAASRPEELDPQLLAAMRPQGVGMILRQPPYPAGGLPSTVVQVLSDNTLKIFRTGAISQDMLAQNGWSIG